MKSALSAIMLVLVGLATGAYGLESRANDDVTWNYLQNGKDWDFEFCNQSDGWQSPWAISTATGNLNDWSAQGFAFLPTWKSTTVAPADYGFTNYVYQVNATDGSMGGFYAIEPFKSTGTQVYWQVDQLRFHYSSEHTIDDDRYALEMQIIVEDIHKLATSCTSYRGAFSIFFNVDDTVDESPFWNSFGQNYLTIDLNLLFPTTGGMTNKIIGYQGTDTMPPCTDAFCWYMALPVQNIHQATLDKFLVQDLASNYREVNLGATPIYHYFFNGLLSTYAQQTTEL